MGDNASDAGVNTPPVEFSSPLPGVVSDAEAKLAELEARFVALEARIKALVDKYFGPHA